MYSHLTFIIVACWQPSHHQLVASTICRNGVSHNLIPSPTYRKKSETSINFRILSFVIAACWQSSHHQLIVSPIFGSCGSQVIFPSATCPSKDPPSYQLRASFNAMHHMIKRSNAPRTQVNILYRYLEVERQDLDPYFKWIIACSVSTANL